MYDLLTQPGIPLASSQAPLQHCSTAMPAKAGMATGLERKREMRSSRKPSCACLQQLPERLAAVGLAERVAAGLHDPVQLHEGAIAVADCPLKLQNAQNICTEHLAVKHMLWGSATHAQDIPGNCLLPSRMYTSTSTTCMLSASEARRACGSTPEHPVSAWAEALGCSVAGCGSSCGTRCTGCYEAHHGPDGLGVAVHEQAGALGVLKVRRRARRGRQHAEVDRRAQHAVQRVRVQVCMAGLGSG